MNLEKGLFAKLNSVTAITDIVGTRIWPVLIDQRAASGDTIYPALTYEEASCERDHTFDGASGLAAMRVVLGCYAETFEKARDLAIAVRQALDGVQATWAYTGGSVVVQGTFVREERAGYDDDVRAYFHELDFEIWYEEN